MASPSKSRSDSLSLRISRETVGEGRALATCIGSRKLPSFSTQAHLDGVTPFWKIAGAW